MGDDLILTFDLGTTRLKVAAFSLNGDLVGQVSRRNHEYADGALRWQQAQEWWRDCVAACRELMATHRIQPGQFVGCSLSGRAGAVVFLDDAGEVIVDPWLDNRHRPHLGTLATAPVYAAGLLSKWMWLQQHRPEVAGRVRHLLYAKDFLLFRLTGRAATDPSSGPDGAWQQSWLDAAGVDQAKLPSVMLPWTIAGKLTTAAATALGLGAGIPVAVGAHDGICANTGAGAVDDGAMALTLGTHCVARMVTRDVPENSLRFYGYPPDKHVIGGNALMAGRALDWFIDNWTDTPEAARPQRFEALDSAAAAIPVGANGVSFLPHLGGTLSPDRRPDARALFYGMQAATSRDDMYRAVLEGATFAIADVVDQVSGWCGEPASIHLTGSGARSEAWTQLLASALNAPLVRTDAASEGRGAAIFCAMALNFYPTLAEAISKMVRPGEIVLPNAEDFERLTSVRSQWRDLVERTRTLDSRSANRPVVRPGTPSSGN